MSTGLTQGFRVLQLVVGGLGGAGRVDGSVGERLTLRVLGRTGDRGRNQRGQNQYHEHGRRRRRRRIASGVSADVQSASGVQTRRIPFGTIGT